MIAVRSIPPSGAPHVFGVGRPRFSWVVSLEAWVVLLLFQGLRTLDGLALERSELPTMTIWLLSVFSAALAIGPRWLVPRRSLVVVGLGLAFVAWATVSLLWSPSVAYGPLKAFLLLFLNLWLLALGAAIIGPDEERVARLGVLLFGAAAALVGAVAVSGSTSGGGAASVAGIEYGVVGAVVAVGALLGVAYLVMGDGSRVARLAVASLTASMVYTLVVGGQRQALLGVALVAVFFVFASGRGGRTRFRHPAARFILLTAALTAGLALTVDPDTSSTLIRIEGLRANPYGDQSTNIRLTHYQEAPLIWAQAPAFGHGLGSWPITTGSGDNREYPHNIFVELAVELGAVGVMLFLALAVSAFASLGPWSLLRREPYRMTLVVLLGYTLLTSQVGGDLVDNRFLFLLMGLAAGGSVDMVRGRSTAGR